MHVIKCFLLLHWLTTPVADPDLSQAQRKAEALTYILIAANNTEYLARP